MYIFFGGEYNCPVCGMADAVTIWAKLNAQPDQEACHIVRVASRRGVVELGHIGARLTAEKIP